MPLREKILQALYQRKSIDQRRLSQIAGVKDAAISRYLNGYEQLNFESNLKIVKYLFPREEKQVMEEYVLTQKSKNARYALDYCFMNQLREQGNQLIEKLLQSSNPTDREWGNMYALLQTISKNRIGSMDLLQQVELQNPKELEMQILKGILKGYLYFYMKDFHSVSFHILDTEQLLQKLKDSYIKNSFQVRYALIMNYVSLYANEIEKARYYSSLIIEQDFFQKAKATAYNHLGHSYLFENFKKARDYMELAFQGFQKYNDESHLKTAQYNLSFLQSYWQVDREFPFELKGEAEKTDYAYFLIQRGEKEKAGEYLKEADVKAMSDWEKAFFHYYAGLTWGEKDSFYESVKYFRRMGDFFHIRLPIDELRKLGENELALKMLSTKEF